MAMGLILGSDQLRFGKLIIKGEGEIQSHIWQQKLEQICGAQTDGSTRKFSESKQELYYHALRNDRKTNVKTKKNRKRNFFQHSPIKQKQIFKMWFVQSNSSLEIQRSIGRPSLQKYIDIVKKNLLPNCPVLKWDIVAAENICGPNLGILKGKTVRKKTEQVRISHSAPIPEIYREVVLAIDIMYVMIFLITISRNVQFLARHKHSP